MYNSDLNTCYQELAAAIIGQACEDYCYAVRKKKKYKDTDEKLYKSQLDIIKETKSFFNNEMSFYSQEKIDAKELIKQLNKIAKDVNSHQVIRFLKNQSSCKEKDYNFNE